MCCLPHTFCGIFIFFKFIPTWTLVIEKSYHIEDQKLMGDLYHQADSNVMTLTWSVELFDGCDIKSVVSEFSNQSEARWNTSLSCALNSQNLKNKLYIEKRFEHDPSIYVVAHPFYRTFNKFKKKLLRYYHRRILNTNLSRFFIGKQENFSSFSINIQKKNIFFQIKKCVDRFLQKNPCVKYSSQEILRPKDKRSHVSFTDPLFKEQWHLNNNVKGEYDINVFGAWESGITGRGVTVCVIDDGLEWKHPDLHDNYNPRGSYDLNADDSDPSPVRNGDKNEHGTRCAGEIAAVTNSVCGVGVAYRANISGVRVLGARMTDSMEAAAFVQGLHVNDVYSCSWGPNDDGKTIDGPHHLAKKSLFHGVTYGRGGYGAIYVVASGNGGKNKDNCNFDGYANSVFTVTIGAVDSRGRMPYYAEECSVILAVAPSSGSNGKAIVTTDWMGSSDSGCTWHHSGTSAAAPMAAAVIALALEMQPCLSWRDVQYLIVLTSRKIDHKNSDWIVNAAGLHHSHQHGFGLLDATRMVSAAAIWESVPFYSYFKSDLLVVSKIIPTRPFQKIFLSHFIDRNTLDGYALFSLEFVQVIVSVEHEFRGSLNIQLSCPSGTNSILTTPRHNDNSSRGLQNWPLSTVRCWGENPSGNYTLRIHHSHPKPLKGKVISWQVVLHGSHMTQQEFIRRQRIVQDAMMGHVVHVNRSNLCHPPEINFVPFTEIPEKWLKILGIIGCFLSFMIVYNIIEYIFCYDEEKKKFQQKLRDLSQSLITFQPQRGHHLSKRKAYESSTPFLIVDEAESRALLTPSEPSFLNSGLTQSITLVTLEEAPRPPSPSLSCEADISGLDEDSDADGAELSSSRNTDDTLIPRESGTDHTTTDFTTDFASEIEEDRRIRDFT